LAPTPSPHRAHSPGQDTRGADFYLATSGDLHLATSGDSFMATDTRRRPDNNDSELRHGLDLRGCHRRIPRRTRLLPELRSHHRDDGQQPTHQDAISELALSVYNTCSAARAHRLPRLAAPLHRAAAAELAARARCSPTDRCLLSRCCGGRTMGSPPGAAERPVSEPVPARSRVAVRGPRRRHTRGRPGPRRERAPTSRSGEEPGRLQRSRRRASPRPRADAEAALVRCVAAGQRRSR
jgi:hypothetical protein